MTGLVLHDLQRDVGEPYLITGAAGHWTAHRRDDGQMLIASGPDELRELMSEDYSARPVARQAAAEPPS